MDILLGLYQLKRSLPTQALGIFEEYEAQMLDNLHRKRLSHNPEKLRLEQEKLLTSLDALTHQYCGKKFDTLCFNAQVTDVLPTASPTPIYKSASPDTAIYAPTMPKDVNNPGKQVAIKLIEPDHSPLILPIQRFYYEKESLRLIPIDIDNTCRDCIDVALSVHVQIEGYSDPEIRPISVNAGERRVELFMPVLKPDRVATLDEITPATLQIQVFNENKQIYRITRPIKLHARNTALLAVKDSNRKPVDLTDCLAAWVTPHNSEIEVLLRQATDHHNHQKFFGYQLEQSRQTNAEVVRRQAQAIFDVLRQGVKMRYIESSNNFGTQNEQIAQRVRLPSEVLSSGGSANCLDGVVLFASLLELATIDPVILLLPGHAIVGWHVHPDEELYEFVDTTLIQTDDFTTALREGKKRYKKAQTLQLFTKEIFDFTGWARLIDIKSCRERGIYTH